MAEKTDINITRESPPEMIEQDIARTRQEMSGTVNEIQARLSPSHLKDEAKEKIRTSTVERVKQATARIGETAKGTGTTIMNTVKSNALPFAMIGAGAAWLIFSKAVGREGTMSESSEQIKRKAGEITDKAQAKAGELSEQARQAGSEFTAKARESAVRFRGAASERARAASSRVQNMVQDNPLGAALIALGVGALAGFLIPESRKEAEMMGSASEALLTRAKETAQRAIHKAQHAAERAVQTAEEELRKSA